MSADNEKLWVVIKYGARARTTWVFRTRAAARQWMAIRQKRSPSNVYTCERATWGPEQ